jgi:hypothetical protein
MMLGQLLFDLKSIVREKALYVSMVFVALASLYFMVPQGTQGAVDTPVTVIDSATFLNGNFSVEKYRERYSTFLDAKARDVYEGASESFLALKQREGDALADIIRYVTEGNDPARFEAMERYEQLLLEQTKAGYLSGDTLIHHEATVERIRHHIAEGIYVIYENPNKMPALNAFAYYLPRLEYPLLLFLPALIVFSGLLSSVRTSRSRQFEATVPLGAPRMLGIHLIAGWLVSTVAVPLALVPAFVMRVWAYGVGAPNYPVVDVFEGVIHTNSLGGYLLESFCLFTLACLFLGALMLMFSRFTDNRIILFVLAAAVALIPSMSFYFQGNEALRAVLHLLPLTYLNITATLGAATCFLSESHLGNPSIGFPLGVTALLTHTCILLAAALAANRLIPPSRASG